MNRPSPDNIKNFRFRVKIKREIRTGPGAILQGRHSVDSKHDTLSQCCVNVGSTS